MSTFSFLELTLNPPEGIIAGVFRFILKIEFGITYFKTRRARSMKINNNQ